MTIHDHPRDTATPSTASRRELPAGLRAELLNVVRARTAQLDALATGPRNRVEAAHRASVERLLAAAHDAIDRLDAGTYGVCTRCGSTIPARRLVERPWVAACEPCARDLR